jgi:radical SAM superfamily enzyme YgiQ (UPF0313 family)
MPSVSETRPLSSNPNLVLIAPPTTITGRYGDPAAYNFYDRRRLNPSCPPLGIPPIHAVLNNTGFGNIYSADLRFNRGGKLTEEDSERLKNADALLLTAITLNSGPALGLAEVYKRLNPQGTVIMGGPHATALSEEVLENGVDYVVRGEGDQTIVELINRLIESGDAEGILGVSYRNGDGIIHNKPRPFLTEEELASLPHSIVPEGVIYKHTSHSMNSSRGCPYGCDFCGVSEFFGRSYRRISNDWSIAELKRIRERNQLYEKNGGKPKGIFFADDNFFAGGTPQREVVKDFLREATEEDLIPPGSFIQVRADVAEDDVFLALLSRSNIERVCIGIESVNDEALRNIHKRTTREKIERNIGEFRRAGLWVHGMFILGLDGDTKDTIRNTVAWAKQHVHSAQFFAPGPLPGTALTKDMEDAERILTKEYSLYDGSTVLIMPLGLSPYELQVEIERAHREFYSLWRAGRLIKADERIYGRARNAARMVVYDRKLRLAELVGMGGLRNDEVKRLYIEQLKRISQKGRESGELIAFPAR